MKRFTDYIKESLLEPEADIINNKIIYRPKSTEELINIIEKETNKQKTEKIINLNMIDTSNITEMYNLFENSFYNYDVSEWDVSNVRSMKSLFNHCENFNCDLSKWDVSKVHDMSKMFAYCINFNSDLSKWDVSNVTNMQYMFYNCEKFDSDLSEWNVQFVRNADVYLYGIFHGTSIKNLPDWYYEKLKTENSKSNLK